MKQIFKIVKLKIRHPKARILVHIPQCKPLYYRIKTVWYNPYMKAILIEPKLR